MILTPTKYHRIAPSNTFKRPTNPGVLVPNPSGTTTQIANAEDTHRTTKKYIFENLLLKLTNFQKIIKAAENRYLASLRNPVTRQITPLVPTIIDLLYENHRHITLQQINDKTTIVKSMTYDLAQPINLIFNSINNLVEYTLAAEDEFTQSQTINLALVILHKQRIFKDNICAWKRTN